MTPFEYENLLGLFPFQWTDRLMNKVSDYRLVYPNGISIKRLFTNMDLHGYIDKWINCYMEMDSAIVTLKMVWIMLWKIFDDMYYKMLLFFILDSWEFYVLDDTCVCL